MPIKVRFTKKWYGPNDRRYRIGHVATFSDEMAKQLPKGGYEIVDQPEVAPEDVVQEYRDPRHDLDLIRNAGDHARFVESKSAVQDAATAKVDAVAGGPAPSNGLGVVMGETAAQKAKRARDARAAKIAAELAAEQKGS